EAMDRENVNTVFYQRVLPVPTTGIRDLPPILRQTLSLAFTPDSKTLVLGAGGRADPTDQGLIKLVDVATLAEKPFMTNQTHNVIAVSLSADGKMMATTSITGIKIWDFDSATEVRSLKAINSSVGILSADGKLLATDSAGFTLFDVASGAQVPSYKT